MLMPKDGVCGSRVMPLPSDMGGRIDSYLWLNFDTPHSELIATPMFLAGEGGEVRITVAATPHHFPLAVSSYQTLNGMGVGASVASDGDVLGGCVGALLGNNGVMNCL